MSEEEKDQALEQEKKEVLDQEKELDASELDEVAGGAGMGDFGERYARCVCAVLGEGDL